MMRAPVFIKIVKYKSVLGCAQRGQMPRGAKLSRFLIFVPPIRAKIEEYVPRGAKMHRFLIFVPPIRAKIEEYVPRGAKMHRFLIFVPNNTPTDEPN